MIHGVYDLFLSLLFLIPATFLMLTTISIVKRNHVHRENRLASLTTFSLVLVFLFEYLMQMSTESHASALSAYFIFPASLFSAGTSVLLHFEVARSHHRISQKLVAAIACFPLLAYFAVLIIVGNQALFLGLKHYGFWKLGMIDPLILIFLAVMVLFAILNTSICVRAWRKSTLLAKQRYSFLLRANLLFMTITLAIVIAARFPSLHIPENTIIFATLIWGVAVRILMTRYDFLPSIERKFELLYQLSPISILLLDKDGRIKEANPSAEKLFGTGPGALTEIYFSEFLHNDDNGFSIEHYLSESPAGPWVNKEITIQNRQQLKKILIADMEILSNSEESYVFAMLRDITERKEEEKYIVHIAHHDALTQLPNRIQYKLNLEQAFKDVGQNGGSLAVMLIDLDRFKMINDTLGHQHGDEALLIVADRLDKIKGNNNFVARLGGDEFIILMPYVAEFEEIIQLAEDILHVFQIPVKLQNHDFFLGGSMGISLYPGNGDDPSSLIRQADIAMYKAKSSGGNQYRFYNKDMDSSIARSTEMEKHLRKAMYGNELSLHFQPQYSFENGKLTGMEALIRWESKVLGVVPPSEFILVAEHTGMILDIGKWVLKEACQHAVRWLKDTSFIMSVNISSRQFMQPDFVAMVEDVLKSTGMEPHYLCLEITESTVINHLDVARKMLDDLVEKGIKIAIDDFGTGYSSLSVLKQLPLSVIKIDRSFILDMVKDASIVQAIITMGHGLQKKIVSEGVEDIAQFELLKALRCDTGQGYLMSKPLSVEAVEWMLRMNQTNCMRSVS